jgi:hypothetical protein
MLTKVAPDGSPDDPDVVTFALARWGRTARLCVIRLAETAPTVAALLWVILRR